MDDIYVYHTQSITPNIFIYFAASVFLNSLLFWLLIYFYPFACHIYLLLYSIFFLYRPCRPLCFLALITIFLNNRRGEVWWPTPARRRNQGRDSSPGGPIQEHPQQGNDCVHWNSFCHCQVQQQTQQVDKWIYLPFNPGSSSTAPLTREW